jgi:stage V sporulation protein SpoVS
MGDVSGTGEVTLFDAVLIARYFVGHPNLDLLETVPAFDINYGRITRRSILENSIRPMDATAIARWFVYHDISDIVDPWIMTQRPSPTP